MKTIKKVLLAVLLAVVVVGCAKTDNVENSDVSKDNVSITENTNEKVDENKVDKAPETDEKRDNITEEKTVFPEFKMISALTGSEIDNSIFTNAKLNILPVWQSSCGPCVLDLQMLNKAKESFVDGEVQIIGLTLDNDEATVKDVIQQLGLTFDSLIVNDDLIGKIAKYVPGTPTTFFLNEKGEFIAEPTVGIEMADIEEGSARLVEVINELLGK